MKRSKFLSVVMAAVISVSATTALSASVSAEWVKSNAGYSYKSDSTGKKLTGWQTIGKGRYYFDKDGIALTGWKKISGKKYYFNAANKGKMVTSWVKIGGKQYYFGSDGVMRTGMVKLSGKQYYFGTDGVMRTGKIKLNGKTYDFGTDGALKNGSSSSSAVKVKLSDVMNGISFGMTKDQVIKKMPYDTYVYQGSMIIAETSQSSIAAIYAFGKDGELCCYGVACVDGSISSAKLETVFTSDKWENIGASEGTAIYMSKKKDSFGLVVPSDDFPMACIYSSDLLEDYISGNTTVLDHLGK